MANQNWSTFDTPKQGDETDLGAVLAPLVIRPGAMPLPQTLKQKGRTIWEMVNTDTDITQAITAADRTLTVSDAL